MHHGSGHHNHHQHHHMHHENDEHEIAADHGHEHMPNLFPIGLHHPGMHGGGGGGGSTLFCFVYKFHSYFSNFTYNMDGILCEQLPNNFRVIRGYRDACYIIY